MNRKKYGRFPGIMALFLALIITFSGCTPQKTPFSSDTSGSVPSEISVSDDQSTDSLSESVSVSADSSSDSSDSTFNEPPDSNDSTSNSTDSTDNPEISDSSASEPSPSSLGSSGGSSSSGTSGSSASSTNNSSSGSSSSSSAAPQQSSSLSSISSVKPVEEPPVVVIPDIAVPTSPGIKLATAQNGFIDYSNADKGYVSAAYTGSKARSKITIRGNGENYAFDVTVGGVTEYFPISMGSGHIILTLYELVEGSQYATVLRQEIDVDMADPRSPYTYSNRYVNYSKESECVYKAAELCAGKTANIEKISAVFQWVTDNISYDYDLAATVAKGYVPDPDRTLRKKTGICFDYASLMAAMLRSQGIPTRLVIGDASPNIYHAWNEIYTEQTGWITPELMLKNNGYNIVDATFYSTAKNKKQIADYISNTSNYYATYYY